jgi:hypothetical protein
VSILLNREWLDSNAARSYPLTAESTKQDVAGAFTIPADFILGIYLPVHAGLDIEPAKFFIRSINISGPGYRITIAYYPGVGDPITVAEAVIPKATHTEYRGYQLIGQGDFADSQGQIVIGRLENLAHLPAGQYLFDFGATQLETDAIQPLLQYVSSLVVLNGSDRSERLYGDIELEAGNNVRITVTDGDTSHPKIRIDAIQGEGLNQDCVCDETQATPIRTINGIAPDASGNFTLQAGTCISIDALTAGLRLTNTCSQPCCGCPELDSLIGELNQLGSEARTTSAFVARLQPEVQQMSSVVLGSRLSDTGCITCEADEEA